MFGQRKITIRVKLGRLIPLILLIAAIGLLGLGMPARARPYQDAQSALADRQSQTGGMYYLAPGTYDGSEALTACAEGYHMASLWEILDVSNLTYNTILGVSYADSGQGPPSAMIGWVRTGFVSFNSNNAGRANCNTWSGTGGYGTVIKLPYDWTVGTDIGPWEVDTNLCNAYAGVWCVQSDFYVYLPLVLQDY